ncbi:hypothetical protein J4558_22855 [Leptolyngbya sp. 15MV]|nr:hypothetical protein J4558_22855 [Leptolyngbya sp. 15MV]
MRGITRAFGKHMARIACGFLTWMVVAKSGGVMTKVPAAPFASKRPPPRSDRCSTSVSISVKSRSCTGGSDMSPGG